MCPCPVPQAHVDAALDYMRAHLAADESLVAGRLDEARAGFERCRELAPSSATIAYALACVAARSGDVERAFGALEDARLLGFHDAALAEWGADLAGLRSDARFQAWMTACREDADARPTREFPWIVPATTDPLARSVSFAETSIPGDCVLTGDSRGHVERLDPRSGRLTCSFAPVDGPVWRIAVHPSAPEFVVLTTQGELVFFRCDDAEPMVRDRIFPHEQQGPQFPFRAYLEYSPDGAHVAVRCEGRGASVWSSAGRKLHDFTGWSLPTWYLDFAWTADGRALARRDGSGLWLHDSSTGEPLDVLDTPSRIECAAFDPTGARLATGHEDGTLRVWDARDLTFVASAAIGPGFLDATRSVNSVGFTLDGTRVAFAGCESIEIDVLDARSGERVLAVDGFDGHWCEPLDLLIDDDASHVWFTPGCGRNTLESASRDRFDSWLPLHGRAPRANATGVVAVAGARGIAGFDFRRRRVLWFRPTLDGEELLQARSEHFASIPRALAELAVQSDRRGKERTALADRVQELCDPKRLRASLAGVELELAR